jgi:TFIIF-interacting CTD phosphatase-like protein
MGMYTELIFGASLKKETPSEVIETLKYMIGESKSKPDGYPFPDGRHEYMLESSSYYFGVSEPLSKMWYDEISHDWRMSTRSNVKNYENEIESFLNWIKPYISYGSGSNNMYAIVIYEESETPTIYYLEE